MGLSTSLGQEVFGNSFIYFLIAFALFAVVGYDILVHPLKKYPGPFIARFTNLFGAYHAYKRSLHLKIYDDHRAYGSVIRHGPNKLLFNSASALSQIYQNDRLTKPVNYLSNQVSPGVFNIWNSLDRDLHRKKRRLIGPVVNDSSMRVFEPTLIELVNTTIKIVARGHGDPVDMKMRCNYLGMDAVGLLSFGFPLESQTNERYRFLSDVMAPNNRRLNAIMQVPMMAKHRLQVPINYLWSRERTPMFNLIQYMIKRRMAQPQDAQHDLWSFVAEALKTDEGSNLKDREIWMEALFFIVAGGDTTATAMAATLSYLAHNRHCYDRLAGEIRSTFQSGDEIRGGKLASCNYLRACIDESLRMSPPLPGILWRELALEEQDGPPLVIDGHAIPKGTYLGVGIYALHHNEEYFPDPFSYKPERWLPDEVKKDPEGLGLRETLLSAFAPFSVGGRACGGKAMAYLEMTLLVAKMLWYFDFKPASGKLGNAGLSDKGEFRIYDIFVSTNDGPWLTCEPRETLVTDFPDI